jgi:hypothetical protein
MCNIRLEKLSYKPIAKMATHLSNRQVDLLKFLELGIPQACGTVDGGCNKIFAGQEVDGNWPRVTRKMRDALL